MAQPAFGEALIDDGRQQNRREWLAQATLRAEHCANHASAAKPRGCPPFNVQGDTRVAGSPQRLRGAIIKTLFQ